MSNTNTNTIDNSDEIILGSGDLYLSLIHISEPTRRS